jgi:hypothetical protein
MRKPPEVSSFFSIKAGQLSFVSFDKQKANKVSINNCPAGNRRRSINREEIRASISAALSRKHYKESAEDYQ